MCHVSVQCVDERMINVHYYFDYCTALRAASSTFLSLQMQLSRLDIPDSSSHHDCQFTPERGMLVCSLGD